MASFEVDKGRVKDRDEADPPSLAHPIDPVHTLRAVLSVGTDVGSKDPHDRDVIDDKATDVNEQEKVINTSRLHCSVPEDTHHFQKRLSFLDLPPEVRNKIYREHMDLISWGPSWLEDEFTLFPEESLRDGLTLSQPALTAVSKQVRAELLPIYYGENTFLLWVHADFPEKWTDSFRKTISSFSVDSSYSPQSSSLRYLNRLNLMLKADKRSVPPIEIKIEMLSYDWPEGTGYAGDGEYEPGGQAKDDFHSRWVRLKSRVRIGSSNLDWTDREASQAAFDKAEGRLGSILAETETMLEIEMSSTTRDYRTALDVIRLVASACPQITTTVFIRDHTHPQRSMPYSSDRARFYRRKQY